MDVKQFENLRWGNSTENLFGFNHSAALSLIEQGSSVLDLGCGDGKLLDLLKDRSCQTEGVDISEIAVAKCTSKGHKVFLSDLSQGPLNFSDKKFDYVVMLDLLEHLYNPQELLREAKRVSQKYIITSVPNFNSLPARFQMFLGKVPENNKSKKGHVFWFNWNVLKRQLKENDLKIKRIKFLSFWQDKFLLGNVMNFLTHINPNLFALSMVVLVEKF